MTAASTRVFHRHLQRMPPMALGGQGGYLIESEGRKYLDASGGAAVSCHMSNPFTRAARAGDPT